MIWDGTSPLRPEHEVAYRGWPTERVRILDILSVSLDPWVVSSAPEDGGRITNQMLDGRHGPFGYSPFDLIPLQKEPGNEPCNPKN
jgi:hypothetical protein